MPDSNYNLTRNELVLLALRKVGNTSPSTGEISDATQSLNLLVKEMDDLKLLHAISNTESSLTISASTRTYSTGSAAGNVATNIYQLETFVLILGTSRIPVDIIKKRESLNTALLEGTGQPLCVHLEKKALAASNVLWTYPLPDSTYTAKYTYWRYLYDFDLVTDNPDFPQNTFNALAYLLAADLSPEYGLPLAERQDLRMVAETKLRRAISANSEDPAAVTYGNPSLFF